MFVFFLCYKTFSSNNCQKAIPVALSETPANRYFGPLFLTKLLQLSEICRLPSPHSSSQMFPQMFNKITFRLMKEHLGRGFIFPFSWNCFSGHLHVEGPMICIWCHTQQHSPKPSLSRLHVSQWICCCFPWKDYFPSANTDLEWLVKSLQLLGSQIAQLVEKHPVSWPVILFYSSLLPSLCHAFLVFVFLFLIYSIKDSDRTS